MLALVLLAGCSVQLGQVRTESAVYNAGFDNTTISSHTAGGQTSVTVSTHPRTAAHGSLGTQARSVANGVWANLTGRFDRLIVSIHGVGTWTFTHQRLAILFGPRAATLDQGTISGGSSSDRGTIALVVFAVLGVVAALVVVLINRYRRQQRRSEAARMALLVSTIPQELWGAAEGVEGVPVGPAPPPPIPAQYPGSAPAGPAVAPPPVPPTPIPPIPRAAPLPPAPATLPQPATAPGQSSVPGPAHAPPPGSPAIPPPVAPWPDPSRDPGARDQPTP